MSTPGLTQSAGTLVEAVCQAARTRGDTPAVTFVDHTTDPAGQASTLTYGQLDRRARAVAAELQRRCAPRARVALLCPHDADYIVAFLSCLYANLIAVPLYAPDPMRGNERLGGVLADSQPEWILTTRAARDAVQEAQRHEFRLPLKGIMCVDEVPGVAADRWRAPDLDPAIVAYLQYTSGSTSEPSGVCVTHRNITAAAYQLQRDTPWFGPEAVLVNWVPFFHDLGLVTGVIMPLAAGARSVHLTPLAFVQDPFRWLDLISRHQAQWTAAPNFALDLCVRRIGPDRRARLDLGSLRTLFNGSENVRAGTWDAFFEAFAPAGLRAESHSPGYGLAEATLAVTNFLDDDAVPVVCDVDRPALGRGIVRPCDAVHADAVRLVTCGVPIADVDVRIVDPASCEELPADLVGEVWVRGPNVADGYWRKPERSAATFGARLADGQGGVLPGRWLRTGDLGFFHDGLFYVAGRIKDLIICDGRNHYPADIESSVERAHEAVRPGGAAAFAVDTGAGEALVVVVEARAPLARPAGESLVAAIREAVSERHQLAVHEVVVVRPGGIPRTTSRKVRRSACRDQYARGLLVSQVGAR